MDVDTLLDECGITPKNWMAEPCVIAALRAFSKALIELVQYAENDLNGDCANERYVLESALGISWETILAKLA